MSPGDPCPGVLKEVEYGRLDLRTSMNNDLEE
jgi:hypothetical protein